MDLSVASFAGLDPARAVDPSRYGAGGRVPRLALRPTSAAEVGEALRAASRDGLRVIPWGGPPAPAPAREALEYDLALDLSALDQILEYEPEDLTLTAECGVTLAVLRERLAARGQELPLEAASAHTTTLGGALARNASGPRRLRFGSPRDRILGARFALGDGTLARSGGKVVKNVAGYGIHRLLCGSRGALAAILEASLKLMPAPERRVALLFEVDPARLTDAALWSFFPRLEPAVLTVLSGVTADPGSIGLAGPGHVVVVGLEDDASWVERQRAQVIERLGTPMAERADQDALRLWQGLADLEELRPAKLSFTTAHNTPAALGPVLELVGPDLVFHAPAGRLHLFPDGSRAGEIVATLAPRGFTLIEAHGVDEVKPPLPPQHAVLALRERIRHRLDPGGVFAQGERWAAGVSS